MSSGWVLGGGFLVYSLVRGAYLEEVIIKGGTGA